MKILGIGNDIIEIYRIQEAIEKNSKLEKRVYTEKEIEYANSNRKYEVLAGRFAAKEAISKAFGTGIRGFKLTDIEILNDELGKPYVNLYGKLKEKYLGYNIMVTISHNKSNAISTAIISCE
ncbi:holo-ACP synthase [Haliovirga abyssi]|uniref:Holo-[acyl-carrier-protein] synthase n=1 Tax=Haliovirga abyssi TaxID=2996794 RepID=A0AAU9E0C0_9FUSO|nr:holo-ACP synthase [Haliovirga abyssi]BDU49755.1 holo-[acyl-carrier-protein] synthase [Haliovirga abyssi]